MSDDAGPIVIEVELDCTRQAAFDTFVTGFGDWWPVLSHSLSRTPGTRCTFEPQTGGRIVETSPDGARHLWGSVTGVDLGRRVCFTWHPGRELDTAQWVEVVFAETASGCRVTLTHGGWERLGEIAPLLRQEYVPGWQYVLADCFAALASQTGP